MTLEETRDHILIVANGCLEPMQEEALMKVEQQIKDKVVSNWINNNREDFTIAIELSKRYGGLENVSNILTVSESKNSFQYLYKKQLTITNSLKQKLISYDKV